MPLVSTRTLDCSRPTVGCCTCSTNCSPTPRGSDPSSRRPSRTAARPCPRCSRPPARASARRPGTSAVPARTLSSAGNWWKGGPRARHGDRLPDQFTAAAHRLPHARSQKRARPRMRTGAPGVATGSRQPTRCASCATSSATMRGTPTTSWPSGDGVRFVADLLELSRQKGVVPPVVKALATGLAVSTDTAVAWVVCPQW